MYEVIITLICTCTIGTIKVGSCNQKLLDLWHSALIVGRQAVLLAFLCFCMSSQRPPPHKDRCCRRSVFNTPTPVLGCFCADEHVCKLCFLTPIFKSSWKTKQRNFWTRGWCALSHHFVISASIQLLLRAATFDTVSSTAAGDIVFGSKVMDVRWR